MKYRNWLLSASGVACLLAALASCSGNGGDAVTVNGDVPIAYVKRSTSIAINPTGAAIEGHCDEVHHSRSTDAAILGHIGRGVDDRFAVVTPVWKHG